MRSVTRCAWLDDGRRRAQRTQRFTNHVVEIKDQKGRLDKRCRSRALLTAYVGSNRREVRKCGGEWCLSGPADRAGGQRRTPPQIESMYQAQAAVCARAPQFA